MEQRLSLVTLGVSDLGRAKAFYEALGWSGESPDGDVVFFQAGAMVGAGSRWPTTRAGSSTMTRSRLG